MSDVFLILVLIINFRLLASSRMAACINWVAFQGVILAAYAIPSHWGHLNAELLAVILVAIVLKGWFFPRALHNAMRDAIVKREGQPFIGYVPSLLIGLLSLIVCHWIAIRLCANSPHLEPLVLTCALMSVISGLFMIITRKKIVMQAVGYLLIDNGLFALGISAFGQTSFLVELGLLLNLCVAVFVRAIMIYNLSRVFHHMDSHRLSTLKG